MRIWQVIVFRLLFISSYLWLELCGHCSFFFLSWILTWVFPCLVSSVIFSVSLKFNHLWSYTWVGFFHLLPAKHHWAPVTMRHRFYFISGSFSSVSSRFCSSPMCLVIFFWNVYSTYVVVVPKLVYILSSSGELLKTSQVQVTFSLIKSHSLGDGTQTPEAFKALRWLQCADKFGNHRCVGFPGFVFHDSLFSFIVFRCAPLCTWYKARKCSKICVSLNFSSFALQIR